MEGEVWKQATLAPDFLVSNFGRVKNPRTGTVLKPKADRKGYLCLVLKKLGSGGLRKTLKVHSLVALTFLGERPLGWEINHVDGNKKNNRLDNLEFLTKEKNLQHAVKTGLHISSTVRKLSDIEVRKIRKVSSILGVMEISRAFRVSHRVIQLIIAGDTYKEVR